MAEGISDYDTNKENSCCSFINEEFSRIQDDLSTVENNLKRLHNLEQWKKQAEGDRNEKELAETKTTLDRTRTDLEVTKTTLEETKTALEETKTALEEAEIKSKHLKNTLMSQEMKLKVAMEETDMFKKSTVILARQKFELEAQCIKKEEELNREKFDLESKCTSLETTLEETKMALEKAQSMLQKKEEEIEKERKMLKNSTAEWAKQKDELESKCTSLETMLQKKEEEIEKERKMLKNSTIEWAKQKDELESKCTHIETALKKTQTELEDTKRALKSEQHVCRVICEQKDDQSCFCREYVKKVEDLLTGIAGLVDCFCQSKTVMHQCCERGIEEGQKRMDILKHEVNSLANTLEGLSFKRPEAKVFLRAEVKNEQDSLLEHDEKVDSVVRKLYQLKEYISEWEKQRNLPVNATSSNSHNASVPKIERVYGDVAVVTEHMRACSNTSKEVDGQNEDLKGKHFQRLQSYVAEIEERDEEIGKLKNKVVMLEERQAKNIVDSSWTAATCRAPHQKTIRVFLEFYKEEIMSKMEVFRLGEKLHSEGILPESLLTSIKDVEDTQKANVMFVQHAIRNYHFTACVTLCDVMRSVQGYPQMNRLGEEMWKELEKNQEEYERTDC